MITIEGIGQATLADSTDSPALPPGSVSHKDIRAILAELRAQTAQVSEAVGQTKTAIETHTGQTNQGLQAAQEALVAIQVALRRVEALIAASL